MDYFYKDCINILLKPLTELPEWKSFKEPLYPLTREETNRFVYLCDLLYAFVQQHQFRSHFHIMASDILARIATLFKAKDKHLRHGK
jgi:protein phosphatase-4 regulatory subunit 3